MAKTLPRHGGSKHRKKMPKSVYEVEYDTDSSYHEVAKALPHYGDAEAYKLRQKLTIMKYLTIPFG